MRTDASPSVFNTWIFFLLQIAENERSWITHIFIFSLLFDALGPPLPWRDCLSGAIPKDYRGLACKHPFRMQTSASRAQASPLSPLLNSQVPTTSPAALITSGPGIKQFRTIQTPQNLLEWFKVADLKSACLALPILSHRNHNKGFPHLPLLSLHLLTNPCFPCGPAWHG